MAYVRTPDGGFYINDKDFIINYSQKTIKLKNSGGGTSVIVDEKTITDNQGELSLFGVENALPGDSIQMGANGKLHWVKSKTAISDINVSGKPLPNEQGIVSLPQATMENLGLVKSSSQENSIQVLADGTMQVNNLNVNKLFQAIGDVVILNSGDSKL